MQPLTAADLRRGRLHLRPLKALFTLAVVLLIAAEITVDTGTYVDAPDRAPFWSVVYLTTGLQITVMALPVTVWWVPRLSLAAAVPLLWLTALGQTSFPTAWQALALAGAAALVWLLVPRGQTPQGPVQLPAIRHPYADSHAHVDASLGRILLAGGAALAVALLVVHQLLVMETAAFETRARAVVAEVVAIDDEEWEVLLRVEGREVTVEEPNYEMPGPGSRVTVLVDPEDPEHVVLQGDLEDHSWLVGLAVAAPVAAAAAGLPQVLRDRHRRRLFEHGAPGFTARYLLGTSAQDRDGGRLLPVDGSWPALVLEDLCLCIPAGEAQAAVERVEADEEDWEEGAAEPVPEDDSELAAWADDWWRRTVPADSAKLASDDEVLLAELTGPFVEPGERVRVLGNFSEGSSVAVLHGGRVWLGEVSQTVARLGRADDGGVPWWHPVVPWFRWVLAGALAVAGAVALPWLFLDPVPTGVDWLLLLVPTAMVLYVPFWALGWTVDSLVPARSGLLHYGVFLDERIDGARVRSVVAGEHAVALRLQHPEDALAIPPSVVGRGLGPEAAAVALRDRFSRSTGARRMLTPTPALLAAAVIAVVLITRVVPLLSQ